MKLSDKIIPAKLKDVGTVDKVYIRGAQDCPQRKLPRPTDFAIFNSLLLDDKGETSLWLRKGSFFDERTSTYKNSDGGLISVGQGQFNNYAVQPVFRLPLDFKLGKLENCQVGQELLPVVELGEYPQSYVGDFLNAKLEENKTLLKTTGKTYLTCPYFQENEYEYMNEKYIRFFGIVSKQTKLSNGQLSRGPDFIWCKVEPIKWNIANWKDLPTSINPQGSGQAKYIELESLQGIITMPFYPNTNDYYRGLWQNSSIRGYLNGINVNNITTNGDKSKSAPKGGDYTEIGSFLAEALDVDLEKQTEIEPKPGRNRRAYEILSKPLSIKEQMKFYIDSGKSFMLHGPSGIGKTRRVQELDPDCVMLTLKDGMLPEEVMGKTAYENGKSFWIEPTWYTSICKICKEDPEHNHVLFIDEITNVHSNEQSLVFNIVLEHFIDGKINKLPDNCVVVAAGNSIEESSAAYNMPEPLFRRFDGHIVLKPDIRSWLEWGNELRKDGKTKIHPLVAAFVATYGDKVFYKKYDPEKLQEFAIDPRGWEQVSDIIYKNNDIIAAELIENKIGSEFCMSFLNFAKNPPLTLKEVLEGDYTDEDLVLNQNAKFALMLSLLWADESQVAEIRNFIGKYLGNEMLAVFDDKWAGENDERAILIDQLESNKEIEQ